MNPFKRLGLCAAMAAAFGCASGKDDNEPEGPGASGDYVSSNPGNPATRGGVTGDAANGAGGGTAAGPTAPDANEDESGDPARAIEEADIIKLGEGVLYALSQYGGLSVIDVASAHAFFGKIAAFLDR